MAAVARRLGIAPATLRTWDRRYGIGPSGHTSGRHRRYGPADIAKLELMQRALLRGASPAEAARYAIQTASSGGAADAVREPETLVTQRTPVDIGGVVEIGTDGSATFDPELESVIAKAVAAAVEPESNGPADGLSDGFDAPLGRAGGRGLRLPGGSVRARGLGRAALAMDALAVHELITDAIADLGVVGAWDTTIRPVLTAVADRWAHSGECVEVEHLLHECTLAAMIGAAPPVTRPSNPRPVLLACVPHEQHSLPLYVFNAALSHQRIGTQMLGAALPANALAAAVRRTAPAGVALWSQLPRSADPLVFQRIPRTRQRIRVFACGPGWAHVDLPDRVERLDDLGESVERVRTLVLGSSDGQA
ncbi:MerR family transcriptional regulator [Herbihabitans rhizosphaerae]|uniref:MerR family transcriptional regulator n=1 Tax=Herbihabitans rhizosphaerae TaxID=1872711 RepID=UPI001F5FE4B9